MRKDFKRFCNKPLTAEEVAAKEDARKRLTSLHQKELDSVLGRITEQSSPSQEGA